MRAEADTTQRRRTPRRRARDGQLSRTSPCVRATHERPAAAPLVAAIEAAADTERTLGFANAVRRVRGLPTLATLPFTSATPCDPRRCLLALALDADVVVVVGGVSWMEFDHVREARDVASAIDAPLNGWPTVSVVLPEYVAAVGLIFDGTRSQRNRLRPVPPLGQLSLWPGAAL